MAEYNKKWADLFPATIGNQTRPSAGVDNTLQYETDKFPQHIANDPVRYDKMNAVVSQAMSNDEHLNEKINKTSDDLAAHNKDPKAHATGIAGNAATATKLQTPRTISLSGKASGSTSFDGSANAAINVTSVNADTASKLRTARKINITGNASGSATFDGTSDININTTVNESKHAAAADVAKTLETTDANGVKSNGQFYWVGKDGQPMWLWGSNTKPSETYVYNPSNFHVAYADNATNAATATTVNATAPNGGATDLVFGIMANDDSARIRVGGSSDNGWLEIATSDNGNEPIYARQYSGSFLQDGAKSITNEAVLLDGSGNTKFPHNVTAANFVGHLAGNADSATKIVNNGNRNNLANGTKAPSGLSVYQCYTHSGYPQPYGNVVSIGGTGDNELFLGWRDDARPYYRNKVDVSNDWTSWKPLAFISDINYYAPTKTGGGASGTWGINITGNAASATNADKVDGYHAADLLRTLGGNRTPVITDIFDRAGTIDMSTMSAADKATHKANINKASNVAQNLWNNDTGIHAYGGDLDIAGYHRGALKLTQSYKNFDKIFVVVTNDNANWTVYCMWDVWELAHAFANSYRFNLSTDADVQWNVYGTAKHGTTTNYAVSTDTIWNTQGQNCGIIAIYGIKF